MINPFIWSNRNGIPRLEADSVSVNSTNVVYNFRSNLFRAIPYNGLILFKLPGYTAPTTAVPIVFNTGGNSINVKALGGANLTSASLSKSGIYLGYYEGDTLQLIGNF